MTPDYLNEYNTIEYKDILIDLVARAETKRALEILYCTMPRDSSGFARVVNFYNQFREAENRMYDGLAGGQEEMNRINLALVHLLDVLNEEYPYTIPLRQDPRLAGQEDEVIYELYDDYEEEEPEYQSRSSSGIGLGVILGVLLVFVVIFTMVKSSGEATAASDFTQPELVYSVPEIGWVLLLEDGADCPTLAQRFDFVFRHHEDAEVIETKRGGCSLLIRFPDKVAAEKRKKRSSSLKRTFPDARVVKL